MPIDITKERLYNLTALGKLIHKDRATLRSWAAHGKNGVFLEHLVTPLGIQSSTEAVQRFLDALTVLYATGKKPVPELTTSQQKAHDRAMEELRRCGWA
jgi:hypothetical protein